MKRDLKEVIDNIVSMLKEKGLKFDLLTRQLESIKQDIYFTAPENMYIRWNEVHETLCYYLLIGKGLIAKIPKNEYTEMAVNIFVEFSSNSREDIEKLIEKEGEFNENH